MSIYIMWIKQTIGEQRKLLGNLFEPVMLNLAKNCAAHWADIDALDAALSKHYHSVPHCHLIYAIDKFGKQISSNVAGDGIEAAYRNQDLSRRPFSVSLYPKRHFMLSSVYISHNTGRPCISAVQPVIVEQQFLGFVVADFDIRHLPLSISPQHTEQTKNHSTSLHHPIHAGSVFSTRTVQKRTPSQLDECITDVLRMLATLMSEQGVFHCTLHFSSSQVMLWQLNEPHHYRLYSVDQLLSEEMNRAYPRMHYPDNALLDNTQIQLILERFRSLRLADNEFYLRSGSINSMNGMVGLSFTTEGSQYMPAETFLSKDLSFWFSPKMTTVVNE